MVSTLLSLLVLISDAPKTVDPNSVVPSPVCTPEDDAVCRVTCEGLVQKGEYVADAKCKRKAIFWMPLTQKNAPENFSILLDCTCGIEKEKTADVPRMAQRRSVEPDKK